MASSSQGLDHAYTEGSSSSAEASSRSEPATRIQGYPQQKKDASGVALGPGSAIEGASDELGPAGVASRDQGATVSRGSTPRSAASSVGPSPSVPRRPSLQAGTVPEISTSRGGTNPYGRATGRPGPGDPLRVYGPARHGGGRGTTASRGELSRDHDDGSGQSAADGAAGVGEATQVSPPPAHPSFGFTSDVSRVQPTAARDASHAGSADSTDDTIAISSSIEAAAGNVNPTGHGSSGAASGSPASPRDPPAASGAGADDHVPPASRYSGASAGAAERINTISGTADAGSASGELAVGKDENGDDDEAPSPRGRQPAFEAAKRTVALWPHEQQDRKRKLDRIGVLFRQDVRKALEGFPEVEMKWRHGDRSLDPVGFTDGDKAQIEEDLGLKFIDAGGMAGGIKAVHEGLGLFLKFAFDHLGFYGSTRMAAKAAKREAAASRWVHAMDSVHVSTPLLECVDVRVDVAGGGWYVIRVQAFARVDVRGCMAWNDAAFRVSYQEQHDGREPDAGAFEAAFDASVGETTMRVGSSDGRTSMHRDNEQLEDVVKPLARHFGIAKYVDRNVRTLVNHKYVAFTPLDVTSDAAAAGSGPAPARTFLDVLQDRGMHDDSVQRLRAALDPARMRLTEDEKKRLTPQEQGLARAVYHAIVRTGVNLDYRKPLPDVEHVCEQVHGVKVNMHLPFDVEVHQLASGQRVVLDTHRLLIPDVVWMDWMESDEAKPRVWAIDTTCAASADRSIDPATYHGQLDSLCIIRDEDRTSKVLSLSHLSGALQRWSDDYTDGLSSIRFQPSDMQHHLDTGCVSASAKDGSGQVVMVAIVSCPRWYYSGNVAMTCLLPPEAAHRLRELEGEDAFEGLSPDLIMAGDAGGRSRARECIGKLYAKARAEVVDRYRDELALEVCRTVDVDVLDDFEVHRGVLKRVMHSFGLGLRHVRLLANQMKGDLESSQAILAVGCSCRPYLPSDRDALETCHCSARVKSMFRGFADVAYYFARAGVVDSGTSHLYWTTRAGQDMGRLVISSDSCVGTDLAAAGGVHRSKPSEGAIAVVTELAHMQRVGGADVSGVQEALRGVSARSAGLGYVGIACLSLECGSKAIDAANGESSKASTVLALALFKLASNFISQGQYSEAMELYEQSRQIRETALGKQHPEYATTLHNMAACLRSQGQYSEAMELYEQSRQIRETALGKQHPEYASTLNNTAECLRSQGRSSEAMELYEQSRQIRETALGKQHPEYATTLNNMAQCLESQGQYSEAMELYEQCRQIFETALGNQHPSYASTLNNMAACLYSQGQYSEAMELYEQCRQIRETALGKQHPEYATTLNNMAACLYSQGQYSDAMELYEQCRQIRETALGKQHPEYATTLNNMAACLESQGQYSEAMELYEQCRQMKETALGKQHPSYASTLGNMAACLYSQGQYSEAMELYEQCRQIEETALGKQHPSYATTLNNMAQCLRSYGQSSKAMELYEQCRQIQETALGKQHPEYATTLNNMAGCLESQGQYSEAMELLEQCRRIRETALGKQHPEYARTLNNMAACLESQGQYSEAMELYEQCRQIQETGLGKQHPSYASTLGNMAGCLRSYGRYSEAMELYEQCRQIRETALGKQHPEYATTLGNMAGCLRPYGRSSEAMGLLEQCRQIFETALGKQHPSYATTLNNMAGCLESQGQYSEAMELYEQCRQIRMTALGKQHPSYATTLNNMAGCLESQGRSSEAMELYEQCRQIFETALGKQHPNHVTVLKNMLHTCRASTIPRSRTIEVLIQLEEALSLYKGKYSHEYRDIMYEVVGLLVDEGRMEEAQKYMDRMGGAM